MARFLLELSSDGHSPLTAREYAYTIRRWQRSGLDPVGYLAGLNVKPSTRALRARILKHYLAWAGGDNPLADMHFRATPPNGERPFSGAETERLFAACRSSLERGIIVCLLMLGVRARELAGIKVDDIEEGTVRIHGKGDKMRLLGVSPAIMGALVAVCEGRLTYQAVYRTVKCIGRRARLENVHPHRFRHTFAHSFLERSGDRGDLRVLLGHTSYTMVDRYCAYYESERALVAHRRFLEAGTPG